VNINWKARLTNKTFWIAIASSIVLLTQQLGLNIFPNNWADVLNTLLTILIILGIVIDPSTAGINDKKEDTATIVAKEIKLIADKTRA
jgi:phi LC3 family holin